MQKYNNRLRQNLSLGQSLQNYVVEELSTIGIEVFFTLRNWTIKHDINGSHANNIWKVHRQNYTCKYCTPKDFGKPEGENVYGIIRAFRSAPLEAILWVIIVVSFSNVFFRLVVPLAKTHIDSVAIALSFVNFASKQIYWAKDIVVLFVDNGDQIAALDLFQLI